MLCVSNVIVCCGLFLCQTFFFTLANTYTSAQDRLECGYVPIVIKEYITIKGNQCGADTAPTCSAALDKC